MTFNGSDKSNSLIADIDFLLFGSSTNLNAAYSLIDRTRNINVSLDEVITELFSADPNFMWDDITNTDFPIATIDLEAGKDHYTLPDSSLVVHRLRAKDNNGKFITLKPVLRREISDQELAATGKPNKYFKIDNAVFLLPVPTYGQTQGLELEFQRGANHFTPDDTEKKPGFAAQFHQYLSLGASIRYTVANGMDEKYKLLNHLQEKILTKIKKHYKTRSPDEKPKLRLKVRSINNYGL